MRAVIVCAQCARANDDNFRFRALTSRESLYKTHSDLGLQLHLIAKHAAAAAALEQCLECVGKIKHNKERASELLENVVCSPRGDFYISNELRAAL